MAILLANATLATLDPLRIRRGHVIVSDGVIESIQDEQPAGPDLETVECHGRVVIPGNVCAHTHLYSALARGMPAPPVQPTNFREILQYVWWRLDKALDERGIRYSGLVGALDAVRAGTTTLVDHHASPNAIDGSLDILANGLDEVGLRGVLCYEVTDRDGIERRDAGLRENGRFLSENSRPMMRGMVGAHASFTLGDESLSAISDLAARYETGVHIHVAEDAWDEEDSIHRWGKRTAVRLADASIVNARSICAHGVHLDPAELDILRARASWLVHNCRSNMNNGVGRASVARFGPKAALGTDGIDEDMFAESRTAFFRAREDSIDTPAHEVIRMLATGGNLVSDCFGTRIGPLEQGAAADLVLLRYDPPTPLSDGNLAWHWMFALTAENVESVMVGGRWVLRHGEIVGVDEEKIRAEARLEAERLWRRMEDV